MYTCICVGELADDNAYNSECVVVMCVCVVVVVVVCVRIKLNLIFKNQRNDVSERKIQSRLFFQKWHCLEFVVGDYV